MLRYLLFLFSLLCACLCPAAADGTGDDALLLKLDGMIERRAVYQQEVEREIAELRRTLDYVEDDKVRFDILGDLFVKYRSFRIDTALVVAEERLRLAEELGEEYVNQG
ncbi:hypothetical protein [Bacteroides gallinarum]|nr:hypothetical protein [Bacteroides gallinarum]